MIAESMRLQQFNVPSNDVHEQPNQEAKKIYNLLQAADEPLWEGCTLHTRISATAQMLNLKSETKMSNQVFDRMISIIKSFLPSSEKLPSNYYETKKLMKGLGLAYEKIDACSNNCMIYYRSQVNDMQYSICTFPRYKPKVGKGKLVPYKVLWYLPLTPRLQRIYMSSHTAEYMTWADSEAWKHFDRVHSDFAIDAINVCLGLCTDGFNPNRKSGISYSCWPVFITVYNLPPSMCMKIPYIFMSLLIPGQKSLTSNIDVFRRPLVDELNVLWKDGIKT
ncbi:hypothetical protein AXF42_Ash012014 [Apostasia shenzhenica]|uniref:Uncharacterized protein n=1 Tax=Apostasia shenzhenica TaxID=1088818 RepID=A0A2I0AJI3_9ASPA|nr:hypothetical protein AXF42_Ash012014 [Apostasia shenzhenica]